MLKGKVVRGKCRRRLAAKRCAKGHGSAKRLLQPVRRAAGVDFFLVRNFLLFKQVKKNPSFPLPPGRFTESHVVARQF